MEKSGAPDLITRFNLIENLLMRFFGGKDLKLKELALCYLYFQGKTDPEKAESLLLLTRSGMTVLLDSSYYIKKEGVMEITEEGKRRARKILKKVNTDLLEEEDMKGNRMEHVLEKLVFLSLGKKSFSEEKAGELIIFSDIALRRLRKTFFSRQGPGLPGLCVFFYIYIFGALSANELTAYIPQRHVTAIHAILRNSSKEGYTEDITKEGVPRKAVLAEKGEKILLDAIEEASRAFKAFIKDEKGKEICDCIVKLNDITHVIMRRERGGA